MQQLLPVVPRIYVKKAVKKEAKEENVLLPPITLQEGRSLLRRLNQQGRLESLSSYLPEKESAHYINGQEWSVQLKEVYYRYNRNNKDVLKHLQGRFYKGECFGLLGGNGVGKSTLLNVISGALSPYSGKVKTKGKVSYLPQNPESMFFHDTVIDELFGTSDKYKDLFKMERLLYRHPYDLSGGEQQRLALLILLSREPDVLLLDEPTKGMTEKEKYILGELLQTLSEHGKTIILASHDIEFAAKYTNRCGLMFDGRLTGVKDTKKFFLQNRYYTTTVRRLTRGILENVVLEDEVIIDAGRR